MIGIQEIGSKQSLEMIIQELNNPIIPSIKDWSNRRRGKWNYAISDAVGSMSQVNLSIFVFVHFYFHFGCHRDRNILDLSMMNQRMFN